jgi:hypothetical protein
MIAVGNVQEYSQLKQMTPGINTLLLKDKLEGHGAFTATYTQTYWR